MSKAYEFMVKLKNNEQNQEQYTEHQYINEAIIVFNWFCPVQVSSCEMSGESGSRGGCENISNGQENYPLDLRVIIIKMPIAT